MSNKLKIEVMKMQLRIETKSKSVVERINKAYDKALEETNLTDFIAALKFHTGYLVSNTENSLTKGFISINSTKSKNYAIITNLLY